MSISRRCTCGGSAPLVFQAKINGELTSVGVCKKCGTGWSKYKKLSQSSTQILKEKLLKEEYERKQQEKLERENMNQYKNQTGITVSKEIRIHTFNKEPLDKRLAGSFERIKVQYPAVAQDNKKLDNFITKIFPARKQHCVIRNLSTLNDEGHVVRRAFIYNKNSSYQKRVFGEKRYVVFFGRPKEGEFIIDDIKIMENIITKPDDYEDVYEIFYDGKRHNNCIWNITENESLAGKIINSDISSWSDYLEWKKHLAELRIRGIKYIAVKVDLNSRIMSFLTVAPNKEVFSEFKKALYRNEMSVFSNEYSTDRWKFNFNREIQNSSNSENGITLQFIGLGEQFYLNSRGYVQGWDEQREYCKRTKGERNQLNIGFYITELRKNFPEAYLCELQFDLSQQGSSHIDRQYRIKGRLGDDDERKIVNEFYGEGFIAVAQIGDFALINRLKGALKDLATGSTVSQNLEKWLFDISKARIPEKNNIVEETDCEWQNVEINSEQKQAVLKILNAPDVCLIQGPPGTGKTTVIAEAIYQLVLRGKRVLVSSQANLAVDNALERLISNPNVRAIRLGDNRKIDSSVDNIREENVLKDFYSSMVKYVNEEYISGWKQEDEIIEAYEADEKKIELIQNSIRAVQQEIMNYIAEKTDMENDLNSISENAEKKSELLIKHAMEKVHLTGIQKYMTNESQELSFTLFAETILRIYVELFPVLSKLEEKGIVVSHAKIDVDTLGLQSRLISANDILRNIIVNLKRLQNLIDKINRGLNGENSKELEECVLRLKSVSDQLKINASMEIINEYQELHRKIESLEKNSSRLSKEECELFSNGVSEGDDVNSVKNILLENKEDIDNIACNIIELVGFIISEYDKEEIAVESKVMESKKRMEDISAMIGNKNAEVNKLNTSMDEIVKKYNSDRERILDDIYYKKANVSIVDKNIDRKKWERIFNGLSNWIENIPDYIQENDMYLNDYINGCNVVGVSCTENTRTLTEKGFDNFDVVIVDEVSKATPPELLMPLLKGRKAVLVGDHRQLPPLFNEHNQSYMELVRKQNEDLEDETEFVLTQTDFDKYKEMVTSSLFEKHFESANVSLKHSLLIQYRMHADIMDIINKFYDDKLIDGGMRTKDINHKAHRLNIRGVAGTKLISPDKHAYWFDSSSLRGERILEQRREGSTSLQNILECNIIIELLKKMEIEYSNQGITHPVSVGVISFYFDQVKMIREYIKEESFNCIDIEVNTVDRFQGKEKEIILISLVRNAASQRRRIDSHIASYQRINVGFSRAQNLLVIVGASDMYSNQPVLLTDMDNGQEKETYVYKDIIEMLDLKGTFFYCDEIISDTVANHVFGKLEEQEVESK